MPLRRIVCSSLMLLLSAGVTFAQQVSSDDPVVHRALAIHRRATTLDSHIDIYTTYATPELDPGTATTLQCDLPKMERGGLDGAFFIVFVGQGPLDDLGYRHAYDQAMVKFDALTRLTARMHPRRTELARTPEDVARIARSGKRIVLIGVENGYPMGTDLANLGRFYDLGARYLTLTHREHNQLADSSSAAAPLHGGLSALGARAVTESNRLGLMIDVSHASEASYWDVIAATKAPILVSHSACAALTDSDRNLTDEQLRALARNGGVIQVAAVPNYIRPDTPARRGATADLRKALGLTAGGVGAEAAWQNAEFLERKKAIDAKYPGAPPTLKDFVDHLEHVVRVAGIDHVGIGSDFDGGGGVPGFNNVSEAANVTVELVRRGYTEAQIRKIWGDNLIRVWRDVATVAARLRKGK